MQFSDGFFVHVLQDLIQPATGNTIYLKLFGSFGLLTKEPFKIIHTSVVRHWRQCHWHRCHWCQRWCLCILPLVTGLNIETSYLQICNTDMHL